jgi:hypothetical protein
VKFHEYRTAYQNRVLHGYPRDTPFDYFYHELSESTKLIKDDDPTAKMAHAVGRAEYLWYKAGCWYYKVWPGVAQAMMKVKLDRPGPQFGFGEVALMLRFPCGGGPSHTGLMLKTTLVTHHNSILSTVVEYELAGREEPFKVVSIPTHITDRSLGDVLNDPVLVPCVATPGNTLDPATIMDNSDALRLAVAVILMRNDPTFVQPDRWDDQAKFNADSVLKERVERAAARGVREWRIGEQYEAVPHLRRPHLGLRWTGEGRKVPKIVPVKGSVVHRQKAGRVPTGHYDEQGNEVE